MQPAGGNGGTNGNLWTTPKPQGRVQPAERKTMTNREAYLDDLDELLKEIDQLLSAVPIGKTKLEHQAREQAEDVAGRARATINCMKRDYIIAE